jgi:lysozyme
MAASVWGKRLNRWSVGLAAFAVIAGGLMWIAIHWSPSRARFPVQGIDVSHHNGEIAWPTVAADGVDFAYIKATEGADMHDPRFLDNWNGAARAGMLRGAYHFFTLCRLASDQATNFIAHVPRDPQALPAAVDLEFGGNCSERPSREVLLQEVAAFIKAVEAHTGKPVVLYLTKEFDAHYQVSGAINRQLWLRSLVFQPAFGARPWAMWQASSFRSVAGISGRVDWNLVKP